VVPASLLITDLGYFNLRQMAARQQAGGYTLSRLKAGIALFTREGKRLHVNTTLLPPRVGQMKELQVLVGASERLPMRLLLLRVPKEVAEQRREDLRADAKRRGDPVSEEALRLGTVTASLMLRKLASYPRQNGLAWALREVGRIEKTLFTLEWFQSLELRRRVQVGLNKGEARNALARAVFFYRHGRVQDRSHAQQQQRAQGLNLVVAAIILWNTLELARAIEELKSEGVEMTAEQLRHLSPMDWEHIGLTGDYTWDFTAKSSRA